MVSLLLLGANGQVGTELRRSLAPLGELTALSRAECDLTNKENLLDTVKRQQPDIIVNAAAYTAVDQAETDQDMAMAINAEAPTLLAQQAAKLGALYVDYSTDYVFDGTKSGAYSESDSPHPVNVYGRSKLAGLEGIQQSGCRHLVFRVSWVYSAHGHNFLKTMLRLGQEKTELNIVADQTGCPTSADLIAEISAQAIRRVQEDEEKAGIYHLAPRGQTSWYGFAEAIFETVSQVTQYKVPALKPVDSRDYPTPARRPVNSVLNTEKLQQSFELGLADWRQPLKSIIEKLV